MKFFSLLPTTEKQIYEAIAWGMMAASVSAAWQLISLVTYIRRDSVEGISVIVCLEWMVEILINWGETRQ